MKYCRISVLVVALVLPALSARAQRGWNEGDQPFAEQERSVEFKQNEVKKQMQRMEPAAVVAPGPEGGAGQDILLLRDRLQVLRDERASAVLAKKTPEEIAAIDAQINALQGQLGAIAPGAR